MRWPRSSRLINCHQAELQTGPRTASVSLNEQLTHRPNAFLPNPLIRHQQYVHVTALRHPAAKRRRPMQVSTTQCGLRAAVRWPHWPHCLGLPTQCPGAGARNRFGQPPGKADGLLFILVSHRSHHARSQCQRRPVTSPEWNNG